MAPHTKTISLLLTMLATCALTGASACPQVPPPPAQPVPTGQTPTAGLGAQIVAARAANAAKLKQYQWNSRAELSIDGKLEDTRVDQVQYGPSGTLQRTVINNQTSNMPVRFLRRVIAEGKLKQVEKYLNDLHGLLDQYTLPTAAKIGDFIANAAVGSATAPDGTALVKLIGTNVVNNGDALTMWVNRNGLTLQKIEVSTTFEGAPVTFTASYKTNRAGVTYMSMSEVHVPQKQIVLQVHEYDLEAVN